MADNTVTHNLERMDELDFMGWNRADWEGDFARHHTDDVLVEVHGQPPTHGIREHIQAMRAFVESTGGTPVQVKSHPIRFGSGDWTCVVGELEDGSRMVTLARWRDGAIAEEYVWLQTPKHRAGSVRHTLHKRDYATAEKFWSEDYVQHSSRIPPGRDGLFEVIKSRPPEFAYEPELIMAENDLVMLWGRFSGHGAGLPWIVVNIIRIEDGLLKEHWDVIEDEVTRANSLSGLPMFGDTFPEER